MGAHGVANPTQRCTGTCHVFGVKCTGNFEGSNACTLWCHEVFKLRRCPCYDNLSSTINVRAGQPCLRCRSNYIFLLPTKDRRHAGRGNCRSFGHCFAALANEDHGLFCGENTGANGRGNLANGVPGASTN